MATFKLSARRMIIAGGFAVAVAAAPAIAVFAVPTPDAAPVAQCPGGEEQDQFTGVCVPHTVPNAGAAVQRHSRQPHLPAVNLPGGGGAIPCTGHNSGECIGLAEEAAAAGPQAVPESTVGSSPTVTGSIG